MTGRRWMLGRRVALSVALAGVTLVAAPRHAAAQAPDASWRTITTEHFRVHFTPELEALARRAGGTAERAYAQLSRELTAPRGTIDLVLADNVDYSNGSATPFPSNRIIVYAHPPVDNYSLRLYDDWLTLVVTHELTHIFHLDRTGGWWNVAQHVFGRSPFLFPNEYLPAWVTEGIAVYYETRLTGSGRLAGTQHRTYARAAALGGALPGPYDLSLATPRFPGGEIAYAYGGLFIDYLARTQGAKRVGEFIETVARQPVPLLLDREARVGFGIPLRRAWRAWSDSVQADAATTPDSSPFEALTRTMWLAQTPRWRDGTTLLVGLNPGREVPGAYTIGVDGAMRRLGRRNDLSPQVPMADGSLLYSQIDFTDPYQVRSDLYVSRGGEERRLTHGARLFRPDARADGAIVAVQGRPGTTRLVRLEADGRRLRALTATSVDTQWTEPRWSPDGRRIAAIRWRAGGFADVVVLDTLGAVQAVVMSARSVQAAPSWSPDGRVLYYSSDSSGRAELYRAAVADAEVAVASPERLSRTATALIEPALSPDGDRLAAVRYAAGGYQVVTVPVDLAREEVLASRSAPGGQRRADGSAGLQAGGTGVPVLPAAEPVTGAVHRYSPWQSLVPRYWMPLLSAGDRGETFVGAGTSGRDVIGRHAVQAELLVGTATGLLEGSASYRYAGFRQPLLDASVAQDWQRLQLRRTSGAVAGERRRRTTSARLAATVQRPRVRSNAWASVAADVERRAYSTEPAPLLRELGPFFAQAHLRPGVQLSAGLSTVQQPVLAISPEDGLVLSGTLRQRWLDEDVEPTTRSAVAALAAYRSLPGLPGFAHHVLVARVAGGWADDAATSEFEAGGVSGGVVSVVPGITIGEGVRTFGVRGVPAAARYGTRAAAATVEYRAPLAAPGRGVAPLPLFLGRLSLAVFGDAASAWCPSSATERPVCIGAATAPRWLTSVGAELDADLSLQYDVVYRARLGVAFPRADAAAGVGGGARVFLAVGRGF